MRCYCIYVCWCISDFTFTIYEKINITSNQVLMTIFFILFQFIICDIIKYNFVNNHI